MTMRDCMLYAGIRGSRKFARLTWFQRDFFYGLLHAAWPAGRFESDVELLRAALYAPLLTKVSKRDVVQALAACREAGLLKLQTDESGRGWGEVVNYRQTGLRKGKKAEAVASDEPVREPDLFCVPDPPPMVAPISSQTKERKKEGEGPRHPPESQDEWLTRLRRAWPEVNVDAQLTFALHDRQTAKKKLEREWFEAHWLPRCSPEVRLNATSGRAVSTIAEPMGWQEFLGDSVYGAGQSRECKTWIQLPPDVQDYTARRLAEKRTA